MRSPLLFSAAFALALLSGPVLAESYAVQKQQVDDYKAVIATVQSVREAQARARINGTLTMLAVKEGDRVKEGEKIAVVGDPKLAIRGQGIEAKIQAAQAAYDKAKTDYLRSSELKKAGYETQAHLDEMKANKDIAGQELEAARSARQEVMQTTTEGAVLAPAAGRILKVPVTAGSVIMAGETVATLAPENYILRLELPERHARFLRAGDPVLIGARGLEPKSVEGTTTGTVKLVYPEIRDGRVIADIAAPDLGDYFVGERTRVYVSTGKRDALIVPALTLFRRYGVSFVKLKSGQEIVVQPGQTIDGRTEILSGLRDGDEVVAP